MEYPNWFSMYADRYFAHHLSGLSGRPGLRFLQIGAFTGDATAWLFDNVLTGKRSALIDVDTWEGSDEGAHADLDWADVERVYDERTAYLRNQGSLIKRRLPSREFLRATPLSFDFIYIDADHTAPGVLSDAVHAFPLLKPGGLIAFDDYAWKSGKGRLHDPAPAIDAFADIYSEQMVRLEDPPGGNNQQVWLRAL